MPLWKYLTIILYEKYHQISSVSAVLSGYIILKARKYKKKGNNWKKTILDEPVDVK